MVVTTRVLESHPHISMLNAVEQSQAHPATFEIEDSRHARVGGHVKACFMQDGRHSERMWVKITHIDDDWITGELDNDPHDMDMVCGDVVKLKHYEVMNVL